MKTIQFILSLMVVGLLASCSADSDVLNEMEEHNQLPNDEYVTVSLDLSAGVATRTNDETAVLGDEKNITSYTVKVFGEQNVLLATLTGAEDDLSYKTLTIKKQNLQIYAIANFSNSTFGNATTTEVCNNFLLGEITYDAFGETKASEKPKSGYAEVSKDECTGILNVSLTQLTARVQKPTVAEGSNYSIKSLTIDGVILSLKEEKEESPFPYYVYPGTHKVEILATSIDNGNDYTFSTSYLFEGNTIYNPVLTGENPAALGGLWIDWYVADMISQDINAEVGGK